MHFEVHNWILKTIKKNSVTEKKNTPYYFRYFITSPNTLNKQDIFEKGVPRTINKRSYFLQEKNRKLLPRGDAIKLGGVVQKKNIRKNRDALPSREGTVVFSHIQMILEMQRRSLVFRAKPVPPNCLQSELSRGMLTNLRNEKNKEYLVFRFIPFWWALGFDFYCEPVWMFSKFKEILWVFGEYIPLLWNWIVCF